MASLTETAALIKKLVNLTIVGIIAAVILKIFISAGISYFQAAHPKSLPPPTVSFGKLPAISFPKEKEAPPQTFKLETIEGRVPEATSQARVFFISKKLPTLMASAKARQFAQRLGFKDDPIQESQNRFHFTDSDYPARSLSLDIINNNFSLKYDLTADPRAAEAGSLPNQEEAVTAAKSFFQSANSFPDEFASGKNKISFLRINGATFEETPSYQTSQALRIDFFKKDVDERPILPPFFEKSLVYVIIGRSQDAKKNILEAEFTNWVAELNNWASYPLRTSQAAWEELKNGGGFIASLGQDKDTVTIRRVYLAYFDSREFQSYLQPIFVFEGDNNFAAYVPAIDKSWVE